MKIVEDFDKSPLGPLELAELLRERGTTTQDRRLLREACSRYREALERSPGLPEAISRLASLYLELGDAERAQALLETLADETRAETGDLVLLARRYLELGRVQAALRVARQAEAGDPGLRIDGKPVARWIKDAAVREAVSRAAPWGADP
jgi:tetratricopeptide (TPR) repeat protein